MRRDQRRSNLDQFLLGVGSLMDLSGQSARHVSHARKRRHRRTAAAAVAGYWATVGRYLSRAIDSYSGPEANRR